MKLLSNPVLVSELRGRIRSRRAMIILTVYLSITGIITLLVYLAALSSWSGRNDFEAGREIGKAIFLTVTTAALVQVCIITPSLTAGSIASEKERQTYDLLITTLLSPLQIALGKLVSALAYALLLIIAVLPLAGLSFLFGGVSATELIIAIVGLVVTSILYASVGLFWSALMRSTLGATVLAQGTIILSLLGIPFIWVIITAILSNSNWSGDPTLSPFYVYMSGLFLFMHPFIALGYTEVLLSDGKNPFIFTFRPGAVDVLAPSPWLVYTVLGLLLALLFILLSARLIRPIRQVASKDE